MPSSWFLVITIIGQLSCQLCHRQFSNGFCFYYVFIIKFSKEGDELNTNILSWALKLVFQLMYKHILFVLSISIFLYQKFKNFHENLLMLNEMLIYLYEPVYLNYYYYKILSLVYSIKAMMNKNSKNLKFINQICLLSITWRYLKSVSDYDLHIYGWIVLKIMSCYLFLASQL